MVSFALIGLIISIAVFFTSLFFLLRDSLSNPLEFKFASKRGKWMIATVIVAFLTLVSSTTYLTLNIIRVNVEAALEESLQTVLDTAHESIRIWAKDKKDGLERAARDPRLIEQTEQLIQAHQQNQDLKTTAVMQQIREHFSNLIGNANNIGFFIVSVNGINLASMRDNNIGELNPILLHRPELFARVLNGESVLVHAIPSDVAIEGQRLIKGMGVPPTMFFASPLFSKSGKLIAVLTERFDPAADFSRMLSLGQLGSSGETYAFNDEAVLISASRFSEDFIAAGLFAEGEQSILSIRLTVPESIMATNKAEQLTRMAASALRKESSSDVNGYADYRGVQVVGAWVWDEELEMGLTTEQDYSEAFASYQASKLLILVLLISTSIISVGYTSVILLLGNRATGYLEKLAKKLEANVAERTQALSKSEQLLQLVIDTVPAPIYMKDRQGYYELINAEFEKVVDVKREDTIGHTDADIMPPEIATNLIERDQGIMREAKAVILEEQASLPSGTVQYFQSYKNPIFNASGEVIGLVGVSFDVTDREATAKALTDTLQSLSFVQYVVDDAAYLVVWADTETGLIEFANRAAETFLARTAAELLKLHVYEIDEQISQQNFKQFIDENRLAARTYETNICGASGRCRPVELTSQVIRFGDKERLVLFARDISEAKALQLELIDAKVKAEEGSLAKSEFLASMSHEIRTPLNGVLGMISLVRKSTLDADQEEKLRIAQNSATSLLGIINDLLDFSKIEAHKMEIEQLDFNLVELLEDVVKTMAFKAEEKGIGLLLDTSKIGHSIIKSDPTRIRQVLINLIGNAIKFTSRGEVRVEAWLHQPTERELRLRCHVKDTGVGIAQEKLSSLFEKFTQADTTITRKYGGTGLGLAISQKLCELLNGAIHVDSQLGRGSDFYFDIQVLESHEIIKQMPEIDIDKKRFLVVDDIEINRVIFRSQLESWGGLVQEAINGDQALAMLNAQPEGFFDFVLLDMNMPQMSGLELADFIRNNPKWQNIKMIMMTSTADDAATELLQQHRINGYFSKPVKPSDLKDAIMVLSVHGNELLTAGVAVNSRYLASLSRPEQHSEEANTAINTRLKILLVEDNEINQLIAKGLLENFGLSCHAVNDGQQALDYLRDLNEHAQIDLILMDCQMPVLDGYAATEKIRQGDAGEWAKRVPIVAMTAHALAGDRDKCLACGMNDFITKPIDEAEFERVLVRYSMKATEQVRHQSQVVESSKVEPAMKNANPSALHWPQKLQRLDAKNPPPFAKFEAAYLTAIKVLLNRHEQTTDEFQAAIASQNFPALQGQAHALKGSSANLGFNRLSEACADLESAIRDSGEGTMAQVELILTELSLAVSDAEQLVQLNSDEPKEVALNDRPIVEVVQEIIKLLQENNVVSAELINELQRSSNTANQKALLSAVEALNSFDYDEAIKILQSNDWHEQ